MANYHYQQIRLTVKGDDGALAKAMREIIRIVDGMPGAVLGRLRVDPGDLSAHLSIPQRDLDGFKRHLAKSGSQLLREIGEQFQVKAAA